MLRHLLRNEYGLVGGLQYTFDTLVNGNRQALPSFERVIRKPGRTWLSGARRRLWSVPATVA